MKRMILIALFVLIIAAFAFVPVQAHEMVDCAELTPEEYAEHLALHALEGHLSGDMNPGVHHQGYSICVIP